MTPKERLLNSIYGKEVDRIPWAPFLAYYWDFLDEAIKQKGQFSYYQSIGADPLFRGSHVLAKPIYQHCDISTNVKGNMKETRYTTPVGTLTLLHTYSDTGNTWYLTTHPVQSQEDFKTLQYIYEHITFEENISAFEKDKACLGEDGLYLPVVGVMAKTSYQSLLEHWCGTIDLTYATFDYPDIVEACLSAMNHKNRQMVELSSKSSAEGFIFYEDTSTTNISPSIFEQYIKPEIDQWGDIIHAHDKLLIHHACGHLKGVMSHIADSNIDVLESISPPPTGDIEIVDARAVLPDHIAIIGGIEPTKLLNLPMNALEQYVTKLLSAMKGSRYILANSDSCPPGVDEEKLKMISGLVKA